MMNIQILPVPLMRMHDEQQTMKWSTLHIAMLNCHAQTAFYDRSSKSMSIEFVNKPVFAFPPYLGQDLESASERDLAEIDIPPSKQGCMGKS